MAGQLCFQLTEFENNTDFDITGGTIGVHSSKEHEIVALHFKDDTLLLRNVNYGSCSRLDSVKSFAWIEGSGGPAFVITDDSNSISTYKVQNNGSCLLCLQQVTKHDGNVIRPSHGKDQLCTEGVIHFLIYNINPGSLVPSALVYHGSDVIKLTFSSHGINLENVFNFGSSVQMVRHVCDHLLTLDRNKCLTIWEVHSGNIVWQTELGLCEFSTSDQTKSLQDVTPSDMTVTKSLSHVIILYPSGCLLVIPQCQNTTTMLTEKEISQEKVLPVCKQGRRRITGFCGKASNPTSSILRTKDRTLFQIGDGGDVSQTVVACSQMVCTHDKVYITYKNMKTEENQGLLVDLVHGTFTTFSLPTNGALFLHKSHGYSPLVVTNHGLHCLAVGVKQEHLVYRLMLYEAAHTADQLCHINQWDRCSIPLHALEIGLKHRQLDTVSFFLKSRENSFTLQSFETEEGKETQTKTRGSPEHLDMALEMLQKSIQDNFRDAQSRNFAEQLLQITLDYLHRVTKNIVNKFTTSHEEEEISERQFLEASKMLGKLTNYIGELHKILLEQKEHNIHRRSGQYREELGQNTGDCAGNNELVCDGMNTTGWDSKEEKEIIIDGLLNGCLLQLQPYLCQRWGKPCAQLTNVLDIGLEGVLSFLQKRDMDSADHMFRNMGFDAAYKLRQLCFFTPDHSLRDYLLTELRQRNELSDTEITMAGFLHQMESLYSCPSFEVAKVLRTEGQEITWEGTLDMKESMEKPSDHFQPQKNCGDIHAIDSMNSETAFYSHTLFDWIQHFTEEHRIGILLDQLLYRNEPAQMDSCCTSIVWQYLCCYLDSHRLLQWIDIQFPLPGVELTISQPWPYNQPINEEMLNYIHGNTTKYIENVILDELARRGVFSPAEYCDPMLVVHRLSRIQSLVQSPHLVEMRPNTHPLTLMCIHKFVIQYCIDHHLPELLYYYITFWSIGCGEFDLGEVGMAQTDLPPWVDMLLHFRQASQQLQNPHTVFEASLSAEHFLQGTPSSVMDMVDRALLGRSLATLMFAPERLDQFISSGKGVALKNTLPQLYHALFVRPSTQLLPTQDINVYQLLQGNARYDPANLFGWQKSNTLATEDISQEMPHFSQEYLVTKYGHVEELDYTYYLKHGRPSFAFCVFLMAEWHAGVKSLTIKSIQRETTLAYWMALKNFNKSTVVSACIAFIEMFGLDSTVQKLHCQVAALIFSYNQHLMMKNDAQGDQFEARLVKEIYELVHRCVCSSKSSATMDILSLLEEATKWEIQKRRLNVRSLEAGQRWLLPMMFCQYHGLRMSHQFLVDCALVDDWVMFLTFAQLTQVPSDQVRALVHNFNRKSLQEHLKYIIDCSLVKREVSPTDYDCLSDPSSMGVEENTIDILMRCSKSRNPWSSLCNLAVLQGNSTLAVLASNYLDHDPLSCICAWMISSAPAATLIKLKSSCTISESENLSWTCEQFHHLTESLIENDLSYLILEGFQIFQPMNLIIPALELMDGVIKHRNEEEWRANAEEFKKIFFKCRSKKENLGFVSLQWVEDTINYFIKHHLQTCKNYSEVGRFLEALDTTNITRLFSKALNFTQLLQIQLILRDKDVLLDYIVLGDHSHPKYKQECVQIVDTLQSKQYFHEARVFVEVVSLQDYDITVKQLKHEQQVLLLSDAWDQSVIRQAYWDKCHSLFKRHRVKPATAAAFFEEQLKECVSSSERGYMYLLIHNWLDDSPDQAKKTQVFVSMWKNKIDAYLEQQKSSTWKPKVRGYVLDKAKLLEWRLSRHSEMSRAAVSLQPNEVNALDHLIGEMLNRGLIREAEEVASHFQHGSTDLDIIKTSFSLIQGMPVESIDASMKKLLAAPAMRRRTTSTASLVSLPGARTVLRNVNTLAVLQMNAEEDESDFENVHSLLSTLESFCSHCVHSKQCSEFIVTSYRIAMTLHRSFDWVLEQDSFRLLQYVICCDSDGKFALAKSYIEGSGLQDSQIAGFISDVILEALQVHVGIQQPSNGNAELPLTMRIGQAGSKGFDEVNELIQVCDNQALLGQRLLDGVVSLASSKQECSAKILKMEVELLICAHDCFTVGCHMEGISSVLRTARVITDHLAAADEHNLMIRLLTRMGRYSEMTYIFDILKDNQQFELLFEKGIDKDHALRSAIMDYLKCYHPADTDMHTMVSLHFTLYREIATILEEAAKKQLTVFQEMNIENSAANQNLLQNGLQYYSDAAAAYVKENCLQHAQMCVKKARLIALQLQMLTLKVKVIGLDQEGIKNFLKTHKKFYEAFIVCDAYGCHSFWSEGLMTHVVKAGDMKYLEDMKCYIPVSTSLIAEVTRMFSSEKLSTNKGVCKNMKHLLSLCKDIQKKYNLAESLGFEDMTKDMLAGEGGFYLKDTLLSKS